MEIKTKIFASDCGLNAEVGLENLLMLVQNYVTEELELMGCDNVVLREKYHAMWVFTRHKIKLFSPIKWGEKIVARSRSAKSNRLLNYMLTEIYDTNNKLLASSLLEMCVIDVTSFKMLKLTDLPFEFGKENIDSTYNIELGDFKDSFNFKVTPAMLDYSKHMNNIKSVLVFLDSLTLEEMQMIYENGYEFQIFYKAQAMCGEHLIMRKNFQDKRFTYVVEKEDGKIAIEAQLVIKD